MGKPYLRLLERVDGLSVWRVDGHLLRDTKDVEFTNAHHVFTRRYVPEDEIWLDREAPGAGEWPFWMLHTLVERRRMAAGASYLEALRAAGREELRERRRAAKLPSKMDPREAREGARRSVLGTAA